MDEVTLQVSDFIALTNQTLEFAYPFVTIEGEVSSFSINQGKFVFFDLKDATGSIGCFMMVFHLQIPIEDGMKVKIKATPKLTNKGRFSLTVKTIEPVGEGGLRRAFELLRAKLDGEGIFDPQRKRALPRYVKKIAVISSEGAAGYADFIKIINSRWAGVTVQLAQVQVQGESAVGQIVAAFDFLNLQPTSYDAIVLIRGGGSLEDLMPFNTEPVCRAIAGSRLPVLVGVGHETDVTLAELSADVRAVTPSEAAHMLVPDKTEELRYLSQSRARLGSVSISRVRFEENRQRLKHAQEQYMHTIRARVELLNSFKQTLRMSNPENILDRGYAIARTNGKTLRDAKDVKLGAKVALQLRRGQINTVVEDIK